MIREATADDCLALAALSIQVWLDTYAPDGIRTEYAKYAISTFTEQNFLEAIETSHLKLLVTTEQDYLRGYALLNLNSYYQDKGNGFELERLYIDPRFSGQGYGKGLLSAIKAQFGAQFWLYSWVENRAIDFYKHLDFRVIGRYDFDFESWRIENLVFSSHPSAQLP